MVGLIIASILCIIVNIVNIIVNASLRIFGYSSEKMYMTDTHTRTHISFLFYFLVTVMVKYGFDVVGL